MVTWLGLEIPRIARIVPDLDEPRRHMKERIAVRNACLQHANGHGRVLGQAVRQQASCRARPHDHVIKTLVVPVDRASHGGKFLIFLL